MKVDGSIGNLLQGVSQQPAEVRKEGQCELQENLSSDPVEGLKKRPPLNYIAQLYSYSADTEWVEFEVDGEEFVMGVDVGDLRIFDLTGVERAVTFAVGTTSYLDGSPVVVTSADETTYLINTATETAMLTTTKSYTFEGHALVFLLGGQYGRDYTIRLQWGANDEEVTYSSPNGGSATHSLEVATDYIATELETALNANGTIAADFTIHRTSDVLYIENDSEDDFEVTVSDGDGGANILAVNYEITDVGDLPRYAPQGFITKVIGSSSSGADDWYLEFQCNDTATALGAGFGNPGKWVEAVAPETEYLMDTSTMPHTLTIDGSGDFDVAEGEWAGRQVGDTTSNEDPSFIGKPIKDIGSFQGRLSLLAGERIILSRTNQHLDFWLESASTLADSDPIDIGSTAKGVSTTLLKMVPHNRDLVIFSSDAQFILFGRNSITPSNSSLVLTTEFESNLGAAPVSAGKNVLFGIDYGKYTGIREFFTEGASDIDNSEPITHHVSTYMEGSIRNLAGTSNFNLALVGTTVDKHKIYPYEYVWTNNQRQQSAWSTWIMPNDIEHMFFVGSLVYVVIQAGGKTVLATLDLDTTADTGLTYEVKLDFKTTAVVPQYSFTNPLDTLVTNDDIVVIQGAGCPNPGMRVKIASIVGTTITLIGDMNGGTVYLGIPYAARYRPTRPFPKDRSGIAIASGKLVVRDYTVKFKNLGYVEARRISPYRDTLTLEFNGYIVGDPNTPLGEPAITKGTFRFPFGDDPDNSDLELYSDHHTPMNMLRIDWTGQYNKLGKRIGG